MKYIKTFERSIKESPIISAAKKGSTASVTREIKNGVNVDTQDYIGRTSLMYAIRFPFVVSILLESNADVNIQDNNGYTALMLSSTLTVINKLLDADANVNIQDDDGETAIMKYMSIFSSPDTYITILEKFLSHGLNLDIENNSGENLYEMVKNYKKDSIGYNNEYKKNFIDNIENYIDIKFPRYKEEWDIKHDANKYNV